MSARSRSTRRLVTLAVIASTAAVTAGGSANGSQASFAVHVVYHKRACGEASAKLAAPAPVTAGKIELRRTGASRPVDVALTDGAARRVLVPGTGDAVSATLVLETPQVRVVGGGAGSSAVRISLGRAKIEHGGLSFSVGKGEDDNGHVNTLIELQRAAEIAERVSPRRLPQVQAHVYDGLLAGRPETSFDRPDVIQVGRASGVDAEWEPTALAHEYGHFLLYQVAPDANVGGDHVNTAVYPKQPTIAWSEGFPDAFAAVALNHGGVLEINCGDPFMNLSLRPARPRIQELRYAQYNETRVGAATYQLIEHLGRGDAGLAKLLSALPGYKRDGHSVWTARDLRDLAAEDFERSAADHNSMDQIFGGQGMGWGRQFLVIGDLSAWSQDQMDAVAELSLSITGPGGFNCRAATDWTANARPTTLDDGKTPERGTKLANGGLPFSANDDCYLATDDGVVDVNHPQRSLFSGSASMPFPYLAGLAHWRGTFELKALYNCSVLPLPPGALPPHCPGSLTVDVTAIGTNDDPASPRMINGITLSKGSEKTIATFTADGKCDLGPEDCGG